MDRRKSIDLFAVGVEKIRFAGGEIFGDGQRVDGNAVLVNRDQGFREFGRERRGVERQDFRHAGLPQDEVAIWRQNRNVAFTLREVKVLEVVKVADYAAMAQRGILSTPALAIDGKLVFQGKVPSTAELLELLKK